VGTTATGAGAAASGVGAFAWRLAVRTIVTADDDDQSLAEALDVFALVGSELGLR
jgi:hypothetical protein